MTTEIAIVFSIILVAVILFVSDKVRIDLVALFVLVALAVTQVISPEDAISGFGNPVVITIWSMYIISAGLTNTNIASIIGKRVLRVAGTGEKKILFYVMGISGLLSAFMNNIGVAALMLPVVISISRKTQIPPSKLLMPMVIGCLLGGMTTLLTTVNLITSNFLYQSGHQPFGLFDFFPVGIFVFIAGILFVIFYGVKLLPSRDLIKDSGIDNIDLSKNYGLQEKTFMIEINQGSILSGKTLSESKIGTLLGLTVFGIVRNGFTDLSPDSNTFIYEKDKLLVSGRIDAFKKLQRWNEVMKYETGHGIEKLITAEIKIFEAEISKDSSFENLTLEQSGIANKFKVNVLAIINGDSLRRLYLSHITLHKGSTILMQGTADQFEKIKSDTDFENVTLLSLNEIIDKYKIQEKIFTVSLLENSELNGKTIFESKLGKDFGIRILGIMSEENLKLMPDADEKIYSGNKLIVEGEKLNLDILKGIQDLKIISESTPDFKTLGSDKIIVAEAVLAPRSNVAGKTIRELNFKQKYGLQIISIWREGRSYTTNLRNFELQFGDAILLLGKKENINLLSDDPDFILLTKVKDDRINEKKAPVSISILLLIIALVLTGVLPIYIAALGGAILMVITKCLNMDEAYRSIEWRAVFLIAGMLPLGIAMQNTGAVDLVSNQIYLISDHIGIWGVIILVYLISLVTSSFIPSAALVVIIAPVAIQLSSMLGISPYTIMMALAISANASFLSPVSHPANVLVMGPGGYNFKDYLKLGLPLSLIAMIVGMVMISVFWPL
jgi:di/tricarboxylate transporter